MAVGDVHGNGEGSLVVGTTDRVLKVYSGKALAHESKLLEPPTALTVFYADGKGQAKRTAAVAVASGSAVFVYRNMHPYYKFSLPDFAVHPKELAVWNALSASPPQLGPDEAVDRLRVLQGELPRDSLSIKSLDLLRMDSPADVLAYVKETDSVPLDRPGVITCMASMQRNYDDDSDASLLVIGTEDRYVYVLNATSDGLDIVVSARLPAIPAHVAVVGQYSVGYRVAFACRNGKVYFVKGKDVLATAVELDAQPVGIAMLELKSFVVALSNSSVVCHHTKGKKRYSILLDAPVTSLAKVFIRDRNLPAIAVGLASSKVHIYVERALVSVIGVPSPAVGMVFGCYHREDRALLIAHESGALSVKMLPRSQLKAISGAGGGVSPLDEQSVPLVLPARTRVWLDQTERERLTAPAIHTRYQKSLFQLKLNTLRQYVSLLHQSAGSSTSITAAVLHPPPASSSASSSTTPAPQQARTLAIKAAAVVVGLGPSFRLKVSVSNASDASEPGLSLAILYPSSLYSFPRSVLPLPLLVPGLPYQFSLPFSSLVEGTSSTITVRIVKSGSDIPLISYKLSVPVAEVAFDV